jgi:hypothetical protein
MHLTYLFSTNFFDDWRHLNRLRSCAKHRPHFLQCKHVLAFVIIGVFIDLESLVIQIHELDLLYIEHLLNLDEDP